MRPLVPELSLIFDNFDELHTHSPQPSSTNSLDSDEVFLPQNAPKHQRQRHHQQKENLQHQPMTKPGQLIQDRTRQDRLRQSRPGPLRDINQNSPHGRGKRISSQSGGKMPLDESQPRQSVGSRYEKPVAPRNMQRCSSEPSMISEKRLDSHGRVTLNQQQNDNRTGPPIAQGSPIAHISANQGIPDRCAVENDNGGQGDKHLKRSSHGHDNTNPGNTVVVGQTWSRTPMPSQNGMVNEFGYNEHNRQSLANEAVPQYHLGPTQHQQESMQGQPGPMPHQPGPMQHQRGPMPRQPGPTQHQQEPTPCQPGPTQHQPGSTQNQSGSKPNQPMHDAHNRQLVSASVPESLSQPSQQPVVQAIQRTKSSTPQNVHTMSVPHKDGTSPAMRQNVPSGVADINANQIHHLVNYSDSTESITNNAFPNSLNQHNESYPRSPYTPTTMSEWTSKSGSNQPRYSLPNPSPTVSNPLRTSPSRQTVNPICQHERVLDSHSEQNQHRHGLPNPSPTVHHQSRTSQSRQTGNPKYPHQSGLDSHSEQNLLRHDVQNPSPTVHHQSRTSPSRQTGNPNCQHQKRLDSQSEQNQLGYGVQNPSPSVNQVTTVSPSRRTSNSSCQHQRDSDKHSELSGTAVAGAAGVSSTAENLASNQDAYDQLRRQDQMIRELQAQVTLVDFVVVVEYVCFFVCMGELYTNNYFKERVEIVYFRLTVCPKKRVSVYLVRVR